MASARHSSRPPGSDPRTTPRVGADFPVDLHSSDFPGPLPARTRDFGIGGMCVATPSPFAFKSLQRVRLTLPSGLLEIGAQGRWQRSAPGDDLILTGVAFEEPEADVQHELWELVLDSAKHIARFLHARSDLADFGIDEAMGLAQVSRYRDVAAGRPIYREGQSEPGEDSIFLLAKGSVILQVRARGARDVTLDRLGPGRLFGGLPLLASVDPSETAVADSDARLLEIDRQAWDYLCTAKPWLAQRLAQAVARAAALGAREQILRVRDDL